MNVRTISIKRRSSYLLFLLSCIWNMPGLFIVAFLVLGMLPAYCASLNLRTTDVQLPNQIQLSWDPVAGATWYDFYAGPAGTEIFLGRLEPSQLATDASGRYVWSAGGNEQPLESNTTHRIVAAARDTSNNTLASAAINAKTSSWEGTYQWINTTKNDNDGKMKDITLVVKQGPAIEGLPVYYELYGDFSSSGVTALQKVFPLLPLDTTSFDWVSYKDTTPEATAYRLNAEKFNKTSMKPKSWKVQSIQVGLSQYVTKINSKALGFEVSTSSIYTFLVDDSGKRQIEFINQGTGMASIGLFPNPENSALPFVLKEIK